jgi:hypothetical protein
VVAREAGLGVRVLTLTTSALTPDVDALDVTLVLIADADGVTNLFVTTLPATGVDAVGRLVRLAAAETGRLLPDSPMEIGVRALLTDGYAQRNQRRRYADRRSFAALAMTAFGLLELSRLPAS